jgi:protein-tyrosine-phosphatase
VTRKYKVLFLCRENSARSIIAEALLRELAGHRFDAFSAGPEPAARVHPLALAQLRPGISGRDVLSPKSWLEFTGEWAPRMDLVIALDESVDEHHAPAFPGAPSSLAWTFANPLADGVTDDERVRLFDKMFWQIVRQVSAFIEWPQYAVAPARAAEARNGAAVSASAEQPSNASGAPYADRRVASASAGDALNAGTILSPHQTTTCNA